MSYDPPGFSRKPIYGHGKVYESSSKVGSSLACSEKPVLNGITSCASRPEDENQRRNYKLLIDPAIKKGYQKIYRYDGEFPGQAPVVPRDPRPRRTRIWALNKADLPVPNFKVDKYYVGIPPQREVLFSGLNDNVDKRFLQEMCQKYGSIHTIKVYYDPLTKKHTGKARVTFDLTKAAKLACTSLDQKSVMGDIIQTQLEPNIKGIRSQEKPHRSFEAPLSTKAFDESSVIHTGQSFLPPSKPFYPTPPSSNSRSPSLDSNLTTPKVHPVDPRIKNTYPVTPPPPEASKNNEITGNDRGSISSQLSQSAHSSLFSSTRSVSSANLFEPISPPPVRQTGLPPPSSLGKKSPKTPTTPPAPENTTSSFMSYEDISPEPVFSPGDDLKRGNQQSGSSSSCDTAQISKLIESCRKDSGRRTPPGEPPGEPQQSPKADRYKEEHRSYDSRHYDRDDRRDKNKERYGEHRSRDYRDNKDYSSRSKRNDKVSDYRSSYRSHDSRRDDYKSRKGDYRSDHRNDYDRRREDNNYGRHSDNHRDEFKYKRRDDRYTTSPRRAEERDRYASSPRRGETRHKSDFSEIYGKDCYSKDRRTRRSVSKEKKEDEHSSTEQKKASIPSEPLSDLDVKSDSSFSSEHKSNNVTHTKVASSPRENVVDIISSVVAGTQVAHSKVDLYDEAYTLGVEACSDEEPLPPGDEPCVAHEVQLDRARSKLKFAQDAVRKRKVSASGDERQEGGNKTKKIQIVLKRNQLDTDEVHNNSQEPCSDSSYEMRGAWHTIGSSAQKDGPHTPEENISSDLPQVEDISPCPSPAGTMTINVVAKSEEHNSLYSDIDTTDVDVGNGKNIDNNVVDDDDDDAMSLSSISSNEDTLEINAPVKNVLPARKHVVVVPPPPMFAFPPPPIIPIPPPLMFNPHVPPPMIGPVTVPPPPLVPPLQASLPPPTIVQTLPPPSVPPPPLGIPTRPTAVYPSTYPPQRPGYNGAGFMPNYKRPEQTTAWAWKINIIDAVAKTVHNELNSILTRDVFRKLVEASAFKSLEAWWDNQTKPKLASDLTSSAIDCQQTSTSTVGQASSSTASAPELGPSPFARSHSMAPGLRASLPKLPTFKRKMPEHLKAEQTGFKDEKPGVKQLHFNHISKRRRLQDSEAESEHDGEVEASSREGEGRYRTISRLEEDEDERSQSPWHLDDSMDVAPAAISVRKSEALDHRPVTGASLYKSVYSSGSEESEDEKEEDEEEEEESESESESEESEEESEDEESESEYEESEEEEEELKQKAVPEKIAVEVDDDKESGTSEISVSSPARTSDQELSSELSEIKEDYGIAQSRVETVTLSQTMTYLVSHDATDSSAQEDQSEPEEKIVESKDVDMEVSIEEDSSASQAESRVSKDDDELKESSSLNKDAPSKVLSIDVGRLASTSDDSEHEPPLFSPGGQSIASLVELDHSYGLIREESPIIDILGVNEEDTSSMPRAEEDDHDDFVPFKEEPKEPEIPKTIFQPRSFEADDDLVYELIKSGLDYEDAHYLKVGFERLLQVRSESVTAAKWGYHSLTAQPSPAASSKRRRLRSEHGMRVHLTGSARTEGYYKIDMKEKAKYAENIRRQVQPEEVPAKEEQKLDASKGKQQSRENRAMQRRLQSAVCNADFGDILKFNKLRVRKKQLKFSKSSIHDWGLFALEPIAADEMVIEYVGEVIRQAIADYRERCYEDRGIGSSYMFRLDEDTIIDATTQGNFARFINHCCDPNCYAKVIAVENMKKIVIYSKRDIQVNEEITYDYKFPLEDEKIPCLCGAPQCRGTLN